MVLKITKFGGSNYVIIPAEFIKVYKLKNYTYSIEVSEDGKTLIYKRLSKDKDLS